MSELSIPVCIQVQCTYVTKCVCQFGSHILMYTAVNRLGSISMCEVDASYSLDSNANELVETALKIFYNIRSNVSKSRITILNSLCIVVLMHT